ncbi:MAG: Trm112 family protein [Planctomycetota bacterium]|nr:Trm112 family protein [Planctomycetota bacterium]
MIDPKLLEILACPECKEPLELDGDWLVCTKNGLRYPIRDGIPVLLVDEAVRPDSEEAGEAQASETP